MDGILQGLKATVHFVVGSAAISVATRARKRYARARNMSFEVLNFKLTTLTVESCGCIVAEELIGELVVCAVRGVDRRHIKRKGVVKTQPLLVILVVTQVAMSRWVVR